MAEVILGGLLSSTFLNLVVVPVLFTRWGADEAAGVGEGRDVSVGVDRRGRGTMVV
jgi:hypothetical protein